MRNLSMLAVASLAIAGAASANEPSRDSGHAAAGNTCAAADFILSADTAALSAGNSALRRLGGLRPDNGELLSLFIDSLGRAGPQ